LESPFRFSFQLEAVSWVRQLRLYRFIAIEKGYLLEDENQQLIL